MRQTLWITIRLNLRLYPNLSHSDGTPAQRSLQEKLILSSIQSDFRSRFVSTSLKKQTLKISFGGFDQHTIQPLGSFPERFLGSSIKPMSLSWKWIQPHLLVA